MTTRDSTLETADGLTLRLREWAPVERPRGVIVITHGHGEHLGRYDHSAAALCEAGYHVSVYDLRGHGRSDGKRGHSPSFLTYVDDLYRVHDQASREHPERPLWLLGHSMGGLITLAYAVRRQPQVAGVIASAPLLRAKFRPAGWKVTMVQALGSVAPSLTLSTGLDESVPMSHDEALMKAMPDQDLAHAMMSMRVGSDLLQVMPDTLRRARELKARLLLLHGEDDGAADLEATKQFYKEAGSPDKTLKVYPGLYHEILNETEREKVMGDILAWLAKAPRPGGAGE